MRESLRKELVEVTEKAWEVLREEIRKGDPKMIRWFRRRLKAWGWTKAGIDELIRNPDTLPEKPRDLLTGQR